MAETSSIEWTDATWNPITGCSVVSPGCKNCYAMKLAGGRMKNHPSRRGLTVPTCGGPVWTGEVRFNEQWLTQPLAWRTPRRIFVCAHGDLFHENVPDEWIDRIFAVMALCPQHTFQVLTKRPDRMREYFAETWQPAPARVVDLGNGEALTLPREARGDDRWDRINLAQDFIPIPTDDDRFWTPDGSLIGRIAWPREPLANVWLGVSVEDQERADERIPDLLATPAAVRFLSCEPLLGPIDLCEIDLAFVEAREKEPSGLLWLNALRGWHADGHGVVDGVLGNPDPKIDWVICGGESGPRARPMHPDWARSLRDQCAEAGVPFFFKQWGAWAPGECAEKGQTRTERTASWWDDHWDFDEITPAISREMHIDDEPDLWRLGKKAAGRLLDGLTHNGMPA